MSKISGTRDDLENELRLLLKKENVYFQPPEGYKLTYPCFVYNFSGLDIKRANNSTYLMKNRYTVTYMTKDPEKGMAMCKKFIKHFGLSGFDRPYVADGIYHYVFNVYF